MTLRARAFALASLLLLGGCACCPCPCPCPPAPAQPAAARAPQAVTSPGPAAPPQPAPAKAAQTPTAPPPQASTPSPAPGPEDAATVAARTAALRSALPAPRETWRWERELTFDGFRLGTVTIEAEPATLADQPVWLVLERTVREAGEGRVVSESSCFLAPDLALLRGETVLRAPGGTEAFFFGRRDGRVEVTAQIGTEEQTVVVDAPAGATVGLFPVIRVVEAAFADPGGAFPTLKLPVFDPRHAFGDGAGKPIPPGRADVTLAPGETTGRTHSVHASTASDRGSTILVDHGSRTVVEVRGKFPHWDVGPPSPQPKRPDWFERVGQTPETAYQAFCNFGRGYHLAKRDLLESAFYWPTMRDHEVAAGNYPADVTLEKVKEDYIAEFLRMSKHRTAADCDDLLTQILVTSKITKHADGRVSIEALPVYGGHTFHCESRDGRWWITKLD
jgi:hypothetical protein